MALIYSVAWPNEWSQSLGRWLCMEVAYGINLGLGVVEVIQPHRCVAMVGMKVADGIHQCFGVVM